MLAVVTTSVFVLLYLSIIFGGGRREGGREGGRGGDECLMKRDRKNTPISSTTYFLITR